MFQKEYKDSITMENLCETWGCFLKGKRFRKDIARFQMCLSRNLYALHEELMTKTYVHGGYSAFNISDPKPRNIHKASVQDRLLHHLLYRELYPYFDRLFIYDSYSCRKGKGIHKACDRFNYFTQKASKNNTRTCYALKCDIKKFFANIDHQILYFILRRHISDMDILWLIKQVVSSFNSGTNSVGLPLGNLTSQLFVNVYMHEFDMYIKQELRVKYYIRYADDFVVLSDNRKYLENTLLHIKIFLEEKLRLFLHKDKVFIKTYVSGVDFLGWIHFPYHRQLRTATKRRIIKNMTRFPKRETVNSYRGLLMHGNAHIIWKQIKSDM